MVPCAAVVDDQPHASAPTKASLDTVPTEIPPCPVCGDPGPPKPLFAARDVATDRPGEFEVSRCDKCRCVHTSPRPTLEALGSYYEDVYSGEGADEMKAMQTGGGMRLVNQARFGLLDKHARLSGESTLLDIGCGYGMFLRVAHERVACQLSGCDTDAGSLSGGVAADVADLRAAEVEDAGWEAGSFDAVTLYHCLEHVPDPIRTLRTARSLLRPGGVLLVEVPNFGALWRRVFGRFWFPLLIPQHLVHFELPVLRDAVGRAGWSDDEVIVHRGFWAPLELVVSMGLAIKEVLGPPPETPRPLGRWLAPKLLALPMALLFFLGDIPLSLLLARTPWSGHQVLVARKAGAGTGG